MMVGDVDEGAHRVQFRGIHLGFFPSRGEIELSRVLGDKRLLLPVSHLDNVIVLHEVLWLGIARPARRRRGVYSSPWLAKESSLCSCSDQPCLPSRSTSSSCSQ